MEDKVNKEVQPQPETLTVDQLKDLCKKQQDLIDTLEKTELRLRRYNEDLERNFTYLKKMYDKVVETNHTLGARIEELQSHEVLKDTKVKAEA